MAFHHLAGVTTRGAADEIVDWFAIFETWISVVVGWTIESGAGTTDLVLSSVGEGAAFTMLFVRIWRDGATDHIRAEVLNDAIGTQATDEGGYLDSFGQQFQYYMTADLDAILIASHNYDRDRVLYVGALEPWVITPVNETYYMCATDDLSADASILRDSGGVWDVDVTMTDFILADNIRRLEFAGTFTLFPRLFDVGNTIAGQYKFLSDQIDDPGVTPGDLLTSIIDGATSTWIVMYDGARSFAIQTGDGLPTDQQDGASWASQAGATASGGAFIATWTAFLVGIGWTDLGSPGLDTVSRLLYSAGEDGTEDIYIILAYLLGGTDNFKLYVQDDAVGTNRTAAALLRYDVGWFPSNYIISGDLNGVFWSLDLDDFPPTTDRLFFLGVPFSANPNLDTEYKVVSWVFSGGDGHLLRCGDGVYDQLVVWNAPTIMAAAANANAFDVNTYVAWPILLSYTITGAGAPVLPIGTLPFCYYSNGAALARLDTFTVGAKVYDIRGLLGQFWAIRTT